jgi:type III pantothenate kinase
MPVMSVSAKPEILLLIDQGNTRIKWVTARGGRIDEDTAGRGGLDDFEQAQNADGIDPPGGILFSSVAEEGDIANLLDFCRHRFTAPVTRHVACSSQAGIRNGYEDPEALGVDRWLAIIGAARTHGMPIVIMDLGTATTLDAVDENGQHLGGMILPGPELMQQAIRSATGLVGGDEAIETSGPGVSPGNSTATAISHGIHAAQTGALEQFMRHVARRVSGNPVLVVTGGAAKGIMSFLGEHIVHDPWLVFQGMLISKE